MVLAAAAVKLILLFRGRHCIFLCDLFVSALIPAIKRIVDCMKQNLLAFAFLFVLLDNSNALLAQEEFIEPPAKLLTRFTFRQLYGGVILLRGTFANYPDSLNFILDTGSGGISLDSTTADYFKVVRVPSDKTIR